MIEEKEMLEKFGKRATLNEQVEEIKFNLLKGLKGRSTGKKQESRVGEVQKNTHQE